MCRYMSRALRDRASDLANDLVSDNEASGDPNAIDGIADRLEAGGSPDPLCRAVVRELRLRATYIRGNGGRT